MAVENVKVVTMTISEGKLIAMCNALTKHQTTVAIELKHILLDACDSAGIDYV